MKQDCYKCEPEKWPVTPHKTVPVCDKHFKEMTKTKLPKTWGKLPEFKQFLGESTCVKCNNYTKVSWCTGCHKRSNDKIKDELVHDHEILVNTILDTKKREFEKYKEQLREKIEEKKVINPEWERMMKAAYKSGFSNMKSPEEFMMGQNQAIDDILKLL